MTKPEMLEKMHIAVGMGTVQAAREIAIEFSKSEVLAVLDEIEEARLSAHDSKNNDETTISGAIDIINQAQVGFLKLAEIRTRIIQRS